MKTNNPNRYLYQTQKKGTLYSTPKGVLIQRRTTIVGRNTRCEWSKSDQGWHPIALKGVGKTLHRIVREHGQSTSRESGYI